MFEITIIVGRHNMTRMNDLNIMKENIYIIENVLSIIIIINILVKSTKLCVGDSFKTVFRLFEQKL